MLDFRRGGPATMLSALLLITVALATLQSCQTAKGKSSTPLPEPAADSFEVRINPQQVGNPVYADFRSYSVVSAFKKHSQTRELLAESEEGVGLVKALGAHALRFPGGSFARKFKPRDPKGEQLIDAHIDLSRESGVMRTILVLNFLTGTVDDAKYSISRLEKAGIEVIAVELGNEIHLKKYRESIPDVETFVDVAKQYQAALKPVVPQALFGIPVPSSRHVFDAEQMGKKAEFFEHWVEVLSDAVSSGDLPVDAVIPHFYKQTHTVYNLPTQEQRFRGVMDELRIDSYAFLDKTVMSYYGQHFSGLEIWITEWGLKEKQVYGNTLAEGLHVMGFQLDMIRANELTGNKVRHSCYQKLHGPMSNGSISEVGNLNPVQPAMTYKPETAWYAFRFMEDVLQNAVYVESSVSGATQDALRVETFKVGDNYVIAFANRSPHEYRLNHSGQARIMHGSRPWCSNGQTYWNDASSYMPVQLTDVTNTSVIPAYGFGYIAAPWP